LLREIGSCGSRLLNVLLFGGTADVSLSARAHLDGWRRTEAVINSVFALFGDHDHCRRWAAVEVERARRIVEAMTNPDLQDKQKEGRKK